MLETLPKFVEVIVGAVHIPEGEKNQICYLCAMNGVLQSTGIYELITDSNGKFHEKNDGAINKS